MVNAYLECLSTMVSTEGALGEGWRQRLVKIVVKVVAVATVMATVMAAYKQE